MNDNRPVYIHYYYYYYLHTLKMSFSTTIQNPGRGKRDTVGTIFGIILLKCML